MKNLELVGSSFLFFFGFHIQYEMTLSTAQRIIMMDKLKSIVYFLVWMFFFSLLASCLQKEPYLAKRSDILTPLTHSTWGGNGGLIFSGLYSGYIYLEDHSEVFPLEINLLPLRQTTKVVKSKMIFTAFLESFTSPEYSSHYFPFVDIGVDSGRVLVKGKHELHLAGIQLRGKMISGTISLRNKSGKFIAIWNESQRVAKVKNNKNIQKKVSGKYHSRCKGERIAIDLRVKKLSRKVKNPKFLQFPMTSRLYKADSKECLTDLFQCRDYKLNSHIDILSQNFFVKNKFKKEKCHMDNDGNGFSCFGCFFTKRAQHIRRDLKVFQTNYDKLNSWIRRDFEQNVFNEVSIAGSYKGFLINNHIGHIQPIDLNVKYNTNKGISYLSGDSRHYWQDRVDSNFTKFKFHRRRFVKDRSVFIFDGSSDGLLYVTRFYRNLILGNWYSKTSGYLGEVFLKKNVAWSKVPLSLATTILNKNYENRKISFKVNVASGLSRSNYDFFPNKISGSINSNRLGNKITYFSGGTIDRRTGVFSFVTDDGNDLSGISTVNGISIPQNIGRNTDVVYIESKRNREYESKNRYIIDQYDLLQSYKYEKLLDDLDDKVKGKRNKVLF